MKIVKSWKELYFLLDQGGHLNFPINKSALAISGNVSSNNTKCKWLYFSIEWLSQISSNQLLLKLKRPILEHYFKETIVIMRKRFGGYAAFKGSSGLILILGLLLIP